MLTYMVAVMTEALGLSRKDRVLEIGTGSGYQTAVLARLVEEVWTVERIPGLLEEARDNLAGLRIMNVHLQIGDGSLGWPEESPFDAILVTAGSPGIPDSLKTQLARDGGRLVIPVGHEFYAQELLVIQKQENGQFTRRKTIDVVFVPLTGSDHHLAAEDVD